jgi:hypothetical protein
MGQDQGQRLYQGLQCWEKPSPAPAQIWWRQRYLWNTMVLVGSAGVSLTLFALPMPALVDACRRLQGVLGTPQEADVLAEVSATLPAVHFSQAILAHSAPRVGRRQLHHDRIRALSN